MYSTTTGTIIATLTREGRRLLADNSAGFQITKFRFSDDEIDYNLFDGSTVDAPNNTLLQTPILEACTVGGVQTQRYELRSGLPGNMQVSILDTDIGNPFIDGQQSYRPIRNNAMIILNSETLFRGEGGTDNNVPIHNGLLQVIVRTLYGYDGQYFLRTLTPRIITPARQTADNVIPCTDPFEVWQRQSQARLEFGLTVVNATPVLDSLGINAPAAESDAPKNLITDLTSTLNFLVQKFSGNSVFMSAIRNQRRFTDAIIQRVVSRGWTSIDQFGEIGLAHGIVEISGVDTGKKFTIDTWVFNPNTLRLVFTQEVLSGGSTS